MTNIQKDTAKTFVLSLMGRSLGFLIPVVIASLYGADWRTDAFFLSYGILLFISICTGSVIESVVVPYVAEIKARKESVGAFTLSILKKIFFPLLFVGILVLASLKPMLHLVTEFSSETVDLVWILTLKMLPMVFFAIATDTLNGVLNAHKIFSVGALSPAFRSIAIIFIAYQGSGRFGIHALAWAYLMGEGLRFIVSFSTFFKCILAKELQQDPLKKSGKTSFYQAAFLQMVGLAFISMITLVDQSMASWFGPGSLTSYTYAERLRNIPQVLFSTTAATVLLSYWSNRFHDRKDEKVWKEIRRVLLTSFALAGAFVSVLFILRFPVTKLVFQHGNFPSNQLEAVAKIFGILLLGVPFMVINILSIRLLIVFRENKLYMFLGAAMLIMDVFFNFVLMPHFKIFGIAASTTILEIIMAVVFFYIIRHKLKSRALKGA